MSRLTRAEFVQICSEAILETRKKVVIRNQLSGYKKYHKEIKENHYFEKNVRKPILKAKDEDYMFRHDLVEHTGLGNCHELADHLIVEIGQRIDARSALAKLRIVASESHDHVYLEIKIQLENEIDYSYWEVDAWDPRIIDISPRPDGSIKNKESLAYGYKVKEVSSLYSDEIDYGQKITFFQAIPKPREGTPKCATPERDIFKKNRKLYKDYTIEEATEEKKFDPHGEIHYLQRASTWQRSAADTLKMMEEDPNDNNFKMITQ
ncbi:hypothetical protein [Legionella jordanis]|uniref:Uncharacterized protein n=1 Tax=Legionella jordanis TaxID=456 RepID=A0A0W0VBJ9_9GAMM|nr:hypothetical protein [Legionella jordanis]KTD17486.1 hypothetical protein Ljor_1792 [Legionella jordanis]RMX05174.1 hypothetical protein EAW55_00465 [Legionella jordanis]RMX17430.1 hypothetical protein EAS68_11095 [Legionella jordanis]VEH13455.1 Uncharacterised protein [Legionella jordanis]HAT8714374.1 hypothetical protein [Legionella jordanis]